MSVCEFGYGGVLVGERARSLVASRTINTRIFLYFAKNWWKINVTLSSNHSSRRGDQCFIGGWRLKDEKSVEIKGCKEVRIGYRRPVQVLERSALRRRGGYIRGPAGLDRCIRKHIFVQFGRIEHPKTHQPVKLFPLLFTWSTRLLATGRENVDETDWVRSATVYRGYPLDFKWFRFFLSFSWLCLSYFFSFFFLLVWVFWRAFASAIITFVLEWIQYVTKCSGYFFVYFCPRQFRRIVNVKQR